MRPKLTWRVFKTSQALRELTPGEQVAALLDLARDQDLNLAFQVARFLENPFVQREFYNTLADHFVELQSRGKITADLT